MTNYPDLNKEPELLKIKTRDDEIKNLKKQTEKHDHENIIKSHKIDNESYKKKCKSSNKKKVLLIFTENLVGTASTVGSSTMGFINPGAGINISNCTTLLISVAILTTNEFVSKLKIRYTTLRDWINVITLPYGKNLKTSMIDKKINEKEAEELKKFIIITLIEERKS